NGPNRYGYVGANPVNHFDPSGLFLCGLRNYLGIFPCSNEDDDDEMSKDCPDDCPTPPDDGYKGRGPRPPIIKMPPPIGAGVTIAEASIPATKGAIICLTHRDTLTRVQDDLANDPLHGDLTGISGRPGRRR